MTKTKIKSMTSRRFLFTGAPLGKIKLLIPMICCATLGADAAKAGTTGKLDPTFGRGGKVVVLQNQIIPGPEIAKLQPDGRIVVAADFDTFGVVRFLANGGLDSSFGTAGVVLDPGNGNGEAEDLAIQPDGKIILVGSGSDAQNQTFVALARFNPDGSLDTTFGAGGNVVTPSQPLSADEANVVLLQPDGKILIGGTSVKETEHPPPPVAMVQRYNADGSLDASFGNGGVLLLQDGNISALALQTDGKILLNIQNIQPVLIERLLPNGTIDPSQVPGTIATTAHTGPGTFQPDGRFVFASPVQDSHDTTDFTDVQTVRFTGDSAVDPSFASPFVEFGQAKDELGENLGSIALQADGKVIVGGVGVGPQFFPEFSLVRLNTNGSLDQLFGRSGLVNTAFSSKEGGVILTSLVVQPDGKILAVGYSLTSQGIALARYLP